MIADQRGNKSYQDEKDRRVDKVFRVQGGYGDRGEQGIQRPSGLRG